MAGFDHGNNRKRLTTNMSDRKAKKDDCSEPILRKELALHNYWWKKWFCVCALSYVAGFISAGMLLQHIFGHLISTDRATRIRDVSQSWSGVVSINNHSDICTTSTCNSWDAVVVLGGGPEDKNGLPKWTKQRLDVVLEIYQCCAAKREKKLRIITTSAGTAHGAVRPLFDFIDFPENIFVYQQLRTLWILTDSS